MMNAFINPLVYATTIPAFKELIKGLFSCKLGSKLEDTEYTTAEIEAPMDKTRNTSSVV